MGELAPARLTAQVGTSHSDRRPQLFHTENHDETAPSAPGVVGGAVLGNLCVERKLVLWSWGGLKPHYLGLIPSATLSGPVFRARYSTPLVPQFPHL